MTEREIFTAVAEVHDPGQREQLLDRLCQGDAALHKRIIDLLLEQEKLGDFLESPALTLPNLQSSEAPSTGSQIGPYQLLEQIGEGGMGLVYLAEQLQPVKRLVALKVVKPGMDSRQIIARFEAERQVLAMLDHANVAKVLDGGTTSTGRLYFVMELVRGVPITRFCEEQRLTIKERLELFIPVCLAIQHAHQKGIIHRDIKPTNVLVAHCDGVPMPKVIDFGVAKATEQQLIDQTLATGIGHLIGTLEYMSPEQAQFRHLDIDTRSDVYSLGVLLYELLAGSTPLERSRIRHVPFEETLRIIREEEPETVSSRMAKTKSGANPNQSPISASRLFSRSPAYNELDWIVVKALEKDRARRYESASALAADVARYLRGEPVQACPPTLVYRLQKLVERHKTSVAAGAMVVLILVAGIVGTTWQMLVAKQERAFAIQESRDKHLALEAAQASERKSKKQLFFALLHRARASRFSRRIGQRLDSLAAVSDAARIQQSDELRDEAVAALALPDVRRVPVPATIPAGTTAVGFDSQYKLYARADTAGVISVRRISNDEQVQRIVSGAVLGDSLFFSPDGRLLLAITEGLTLRVWRLADGQSVIEGNYRDCWRNAFSADCRYLAVGQKDEVICFDLATGRELRRWRVGGKINSLAFHPNSQQLAVGQSKASVIEIYDVATATLSTRLNVGAMQDQVVAWHPDGERLATSGFEPRIQIWDVRTGRKLATMEGHSKLVATLTFHPDGTLLASYSWDGSLRFWDPATGRILLQLPFTISGHPRFSINGRWVAGMPSGGRLELLEVSSSAEYRTLVVSGALGRGAHNPADISPDGRLLAVGKAEGVEPGVRLWDLWAGKEVATLPGETSFVFFDTTSSAHVGSGSQASGGDNVSTNTARQLGWALLTCGPAGLWNWPVKSDESQLECRLQLGPPRQLSSLGRAWFTRRPDGRTLAAVTQEGGANQVLDIQTGSVQHRLGIHPNGDVRALSPDGKWAASSGWHSQSVRLWNVASGRPIHEWTVGKQNFVFSTPDSRRLIISRSDEISFWDVETLKPTLRLARYAAHTPSHVAFSSDGKLMAVEMAPGTIHLKEVSSGRTVVTLDDPHGDRSTWIGFTPDDTQLVVVSSYANTVHLWDLEAIRTRLKSMNLDWDWPPFPDARATGAAWKPKSPQQQSAFKPLMVDVVVGEMVKAR